MRISIENYSLEEIQHFLQTHLSQEILKNKEHKYWSDFFSSGLLGFATTRYNVNPHFLYRTRTNYNPITKSRVNFFSNICDLWAPEPTNIQRLGRCNAIGESILYCSTKPNTNLFEIKPKEGYEITTIEYSVTNPIKHLNVIGVSVLSKLDSGLSKLFANHFHFKNANSDYIQKIKLIDNILSKMFKTNIDHSNEYLYNLTVGVSNFLLSKNKVQSSTLPIPNGIIYPSVSLVIGGVNFALNPEYSKSVLKPLRVFKYKILEKLDSHHYVLQMKNSSDQISSDGTIMWKLDLREKEYITDLNVNN